jgi:hypothetical protein
MSRGKSSDAGEPGCALHCARLLRAADLHRRTRIDSGRCRYQGAKRRTCRFAQSAHSRSWLADRESESSARAIVARVTGAYRRSHAESLLLKRIRSDGSTGHSFEANSVECWPSLLPLSNLVSPDLISQFGLRRRLSVISDQSSRDCE